MEKKITMPLTADKTKDLRAGDNVLISGVIYTGRDAAHKRLCELLAETLDLGWFEECSHLGLPDFWLVKVFAG